MDAKLKSILNLALHPSTNEGEAAAALNRARALASKYGLETLLEEDTKTSAPSPTRTQTVYRNPNHTHSLTLNMKVLPRWQHNFIERLFKDCAYFECSVEMISCRSQTKLETGGLDMQVKLHGTADSIKKFNQEIDNWFAEMSSKTSRPQKPAASQTQRPPKREAPRQAPPAPKPTADSTLQPKSKPWYQFW